MRPLRFLTASLLLLPLPLFAQLGSKNTLQMGGSSSSSARYPAPGNAANGAPIPALLRSAHTVFLTNAGADAGLFPHPFSGSKSRVYDRFYADIVASKALTPTSAPGDADLVLAIELLAPSGSPGADKSKGYADPLPEVRLAIIDRQSQIMLWNLSTTVESANLQKTHDINLDRAVDAAVDELLALHAAP